jgi:plastocyanin
MRTWLAVTVGALAICGIYALALSGHLWSQAHASPASTTGVSMTSSFSFSPDPVTIHVGDTVTWTNDATIDHTTTSDTGLWASGHITAGKTFSETTVFTTAGTYKYHCSIHATHNSDGTWSGMIGTIIVQDASTPTGSPISTGTPSPTATSTPTSTASPTGTRFVFLPAVFNVFGGLNQAVSAVNYAFQPNPITVAPGTKVTWTNTTSSTTHTVTADDGSFDSGDLLAGQQFSLTFTSTGTNMRYYCKYHGAPGGGGMSGTINVVAAPAAASW